MPTYDYRCNACGHEFEEFQSFSEKVLVTCPKCKKKKLQRLFGTGSAILFKGSGFYETDYRSDGYKASAKADSEKSTDTSSKPTASGSTDSSTSKPTGVNLVQNRLVNPAARRERNNGPSRVCSRLPSLSPVVAGCDFRMATVSVLYPTLSLNRLGALAGRALHSTCRASNNSGDGGRDRNP